MSDTIVTLTPLTKTIYNSTKITMVLQYFNTMCHTKPSSLLKFWTHGKDD